MITPSKTTALSLLEVKGVAKGKEADPFYHTALWLHVRALALERDHYICQICLQAWRDGQRDTRPRTATTVHHVIPRKERPDLALCLDNLQSVCPKCHNGEHPEKGLPGAGAKQQRPTRARVIRIGG